MTLWPAREGKCITCERRPRKGEKEGHEMSEWNGWEGEGPGEGGTEGGRDRGKVGSSRARSGDADGNRSRPRAQPTPLSLSLSLSLVLKNGAF